MNDTRECHLKPTGNLTTINDDAVTSGAMATSSNCTSAPAAEATSLSVTPAAGATLSGTGTTSGELCCWSRAAPPAAICSCHLQKLAPPAPAATCTTTLLTDAAGSCQIKKKRYLWPEGFGSDCDASMLDNFLNIGSGALLAQASQPPAA